jgi:hypothetical protein
MNQRKDLTGQSRFMGYPNICLIAANLRTLRPERK